METDNSVIRISAKVISYVLHPLFMPFVGIWLIYNLPTGASFFSHPELKTVTYRLTILMTVVMPLISVMLMKQTKMISSLEMNNRKERLLPFLMQLFFFLATYFLFKLYLPLNNLIFAALAGGMISLTLLFFITIGWKISVHTAGIGGIVGLLLATGEVEGFNPLYLLIVSIAAASIVATSRIILKSHTASQVYAGFLLGFLCEYLAISLGIVF